MIKEYVDTVNVDLTDKCILKCSKCPRNFPETDLSKHEDISIQDFTKLCDHFVSIRICGQMSDPIYHPDFLILLEIALSKCKKIDIHTNGYGKKRSFWEKAFNLSRGVKKCRWKFALDGLPDQSHIYRENQDGFEVWETMKAGSLLGVRIEWNYIIFKYNQHSIKSAKKLAKQHNMEFCLVNSSRWDGEDDPLKPDKKEHYIIKKSKYLRNKNYEKKKVLKPRCMGYNKDQMARAYGSQNLLLGCRFADPVYQQVSNDRAWDIIYNDSMKLKNFNSVQEVYDTPNWKEFQRRLIEEPDKAPELCKQICSHSDMSRKVDYDID